MPLETSDSGDVELHVVDLLSQVSSKSFHVDEELMSICDLVMGFQPGTSFLRTQFCIQVFLCDQRQGLQGNAHHTPGASLVREGRCPNLGFWPFGCHVCLSHAPMKDATQFEFWYIHGNIGLYLAHLLACP